MKTRMIPYLIPDMPTIHELLPWLKQIDENKYYSNFGPLLAEFEISLYDYLQARAFAPIHLATCQSDSSALELTLGALNLAPQSPILMPSFAFAGTALAVINAGHQPVFADVDPRQWLLSPDIAYDILKTTKVAAIIPVATHGVPQPIQGWDRLSEQTQIPIVIDAAAATAGQKIGSHCHVCFSLHATHLLGVGEGGLIVSQDKELIANIRQLTNFGFIEKVSQQRGTNSKLSEYHAAVGLASLARLAKKEETLNFLRHRYYELLAQQDYIQLQENAKQITSTTFAIKLSDQFPAEGVSHYLTKHGIQTRKIYHPPLHLQPSFANYTIAGPLTVTNDLAEHVLCLPYHTDLSETELAFVVAKLIEYAKSVEVSTA